MNYLIIGNGIIAYTTAFRLLQQIKPQDRITLIGPKHREGSASLAAGAMLNCYGEVSAYSHRTAPSQYHFSLSRQALQAWGSFKQSLEDLSNHFDLAPQHASNTIGRGTYIINNCVSDEWDDRNFDAILNSLTEHQAVFDQIAPSDIPNYQPNQRDRAARALYIHEEGWISPAPLLHQLGILFEQHPQCLCFDAEVKRISCHNNKFQEVSLTNGDHLSADRCLLAAGTHCQSILSASHLDLPIQRLFFGVGVSLQLASKEVNLEHVIRTPNRGGACGIYAIPYHNHGLHQKPGQHSKANAQSHATLLIGASNQLSPKPVYRGRVISIERLMKGAVNEINGYLYNAELEAIKVGWRPTTVDTYPLIGPTSIKNLFMATGTKRDGFHLSPVLSTIIADQLTHRETDAQIELFHPERSIIRDFDRETSVEIIVNSLMSEQFQHGYSPSNIRMNHQVRDQYRQEIEKLHDEIGAIDWGIHPELVQMYRQGYIR